MFDITPSYIAYSYPNSTFTGSVYYAVPKTGGTPVLLASSLVSGGTGGDYLYSEDSAGNMTRIKLDGTGKIKKTARQLNGYSQNGSSDWHYGFNPVDGRLLLSSIDNKIKSYGITEDFTVATGVTVGTLPINLNNFRSLGLSGDMLSIAGNAIILCPLDVMCFY